MSPAVTPVVASLVLAAGLGRRFGSDKRRARLPDGRALLEAVLHTQALACGETWVVLRPGDDWGAELCARSGARVVLADDADRGMGRSLAAGLQALHAGSRAEATLVSLADMPRVQPDTLRALIDAFSRDGQPAWPWHAGRPGHPRLLPRALWPTLFGLDSDEGARHVVDWTHAHRVEVADPGIHIDVDTQQDLGG